MIGENIQTQLVKLKFGCQIPTFFWSGHLPSEIQIAGKKKCE